ncbi:MAG: aldo/keto reductase, partial [Planctomycetia bacterium]|nr:aldo/keto reductase [Planctomycetia bacterium]
NVSRLTLGTMTFGSQVEEPTARSIVDLCLERGINFLDTANVYNAGKTEQIVGRILTGRRAKIVLASKVGIKMGDRPDEQGLSPAAIRKAIDDSLRRLQTDYVDLYYLHQPDYSTPLEDSLAAMHELVQAGKVRYVAASNYASWQISRMLWLADKNGWQPIVAVQPMYNLLARRIETELLPCCRDFGLALVPYNPLAGGLVSGKHQAAAPIPGTRFERMPLYRDRYWHAQNFAAVERLKQIAKAAERSIVELAIGWLLAQSAVTSVILGVSSMDHLTAALTAAEQPPLPPEILSACDEVWNDLRGIAPNYNR